MNDTSLKTKPVLNKINSNNLLQKEHTDLFKTNYRLRKIFSYKKNNAYNFNKLLPTNNNQILVIKNPNPNMNKSNDSNEQLPLYITHVTLNLDVLNIRPLTSSTWKYNSIRKNANNFSNILINTRLIRSK